MTIASDALAQCRQGARSSAANVGLTGARSSWVAHRQLALRLALETPYTLLAWPAK